MVSPTKFYVEYPDQKWENVGLQSLFSAQVIEASAIDPQDKDAPTGVFVDNYLKVINPTNYDGDTRWPSVVKKYYWTECKGPVRKLNFNEYVSLIHSIFPCKALPGGWGITREFKKKD